MGQTRRYCFQEDDAVAAQRQLAPALRLSFGATPAGFSLIELVLVIVIIGVIAAIAIPRLSRGSDAAAEAAVYENLAVLQKAIDMYAAEHGNFPDPDQVGDQLTLYSDSNGAVTKSKSPDHPFGPYVRKLPPLTTGPNKGSSRISPTNGDGVGWLYDSKTGAVTANLGNSNSGSGPTSAPSGDPTSLPPITN